MSCETLLQKLLAFLTKHCQTESEIRRLERWKTKYTDLIGYVQHRQRELWGEDSDELDDDLITPEMLEQVEDLSRDEYKVDEIIDDTLDDIHQVAEFLEELKKFKSEHDDKLRALKSLRLTLSSRNTKY